MALVFYAARETKATIRVYGKGASISEAMGNALETIHKLHPTSEKAQARILSSLQSLLPQGYWELRSSITGKPIVDLTEGGLSNDS